MLNQKFYAIDLKTYETKAYVSSILAKTMKTGCVTFTNADELLADRNMTGPRIVEVFNKIYNKTGAKRLFKLVEDTPITNTHWDSGEYSSKLGVTNTSPKEVKAKAVKIAKPSKGRGAFYDKVVKVVVKENPRKTGTRAWHIFEVIMANKGGINYELLIEKSEDLGYSKGAVREDVAHDLKKGRIELS
jgi:hypothetical protein